MSDQKRHIIIVGGGIIGSTTAYFLTRHPKYNPSLHRITLLEATASIANGASGKAGGLLGLWAYPSCLVPLSYRLHRELADRHDGAQRWGYRRVQCGSISAFIETAGKPVERKQYEGAKGAADAHLLSKTEDGPVGNDGDGVVTDNGTAGANGKAGDEDEEWAKIPKQDTYATQLLHDSPLPNDLDYIDPRVVIHFSEMGGPETGATSQVHPYHFTTSIAKLAEEAGVEFMYNAYVTNIRQDSMRVKGVDYTDRESGEKKSITLTSSDDGSVANLDVIVTAGPWTGKLLPKTQISGLRAHSVVYDADVSPYAIFTDIQLPRDFAPEHRSANGEKRKHKGRVDPEIYARPFGEVYACGETDRQTPLPATADLVQPNISSCDDLTSYISLISPPLASAPIKAKQACYLPRHVRFGEEKNPLLGPTGTEGLWVAAGHTCWGIQNGPGTGCLMAEYLMDGEARSADVKSLDPRKYKI